MAPSNVECIGCRVTTTARGHPCVQGRLAYNGLCISLCFASAPRGPAHTMHKTFVKGMSSFLAYAEVHPCHARRLPKRSCGFVSGQ